MPAAAAPDDFHRKFGSEPFASGLPEGLVQLLAASSAAQALLEEMTILLIGLLASVRAALPVHVLRRAGGKGLSGARWRENRVLQRRGALADDLVLSGCPGYMIHDVVINMSKGFAAVWV